MYMGYLCGTVSHTDPFPPIKVHIVYTGKAFCMRCLLCDERDTLSMDQRECVGDCGKTLGLHCDVLAGGAAAGNTQASGTSV
jgi:hypothetical protein